MKLNRKFLGIFLSLGFVLTFNLAVGAMENENKENLEIETPLGTPIEFVVMEKESLKNRIDSYGKIKSILEEFGVFDEELKDTFLLYSCLDKMENLVELLEKNSDYIYEKKLNDKNFKKIFDSTVLKTFSSRNKISSDLFDSAKEDIKKYLVNKFNNLEGSLEKVKKEYEEIKEGERTSTVAKSEYEFSIKDVTQALERYKKLLAGINSLTYDEFKN